MKILFILKFRETSGGHSYSHSYFSSGLYCSTKFVVDMLARSGVDANLVQVIDNNDIDREVTLYKPDVVIIEALWVVPEKFDILKRLHPDVKWVVRLHSNIPFLANEGVAVSWIKQYEDRGIQVAVNDKRMLLDIKEIIRSASYLPNFYPVYRPIRQPDCDDVIKIGCFGAIRPLKNQLIQAISAIRFANNINKNLDFHINGGRVEMGGNSVLSNLRALFAGTRHNLIEHNWMSHGRFLTLLSKMDLGMQVSLSETFSIVAADMVSVGLPVVVSHEIEWASFLSKANPTDSKSIVEKLNLAYVFPGLNIVANRHGLRNSSREAKQKWLKFVKIEWEIV